MTAQAGYPGLKKRAPGPKEALGCYARLGVGDMLVVTGFDWSLKYHGRTRNPGQETRFLSCRNRFSGIDFLLQNGNSALYCDCFSSGTKLLVGVAVNTI